MIRVLHVLKSLTSGGAQTMIMNLYRAIDRNVVQFDFVVCSTGDDFYTQEVRILGGRIFRAPSYNGKNHFSYIKWWNRFFEEHEEYEIVHGHLRSTASIYLKVAQKHGRVTIAHSHSVANNRGITRVVKAVMQKNITKYADFLFACSLDAGIWLFGKKAVLSKNFYLLKNAIAVERFEFNPDVRCKIRNQLGIQDYFVIGHVGRFEEPKNHQFIIEVFSELVKIHPKSRLLLIGTGANLDEIKRIVIKKSLEDKVIFLGERTDIDQLMCGMDAFIFPSLYEGLGIAAIEAQASSLPVFASDKVPQEACITKYMQRLSLADPPNHWAAEISKAMNIERMFERDEIGKIIDNGYEINSQAKRLTEIYLMLLNEGD